jgi:hypothetical protein
MTRTYGFNDAAGDLANMPKLITGCTKTKHKVSMTQFESMNHTLAFQFPFHREFSLVCFVDRGVDLDWRITMPMWILSYPSPTAIISRCPQCVGI